MDLYSWKNKGLDYREFMDYILKCGHAELVPEEQLKLKNGKGWYIPYHRVLSSQESLWVVLGCTASCQGTSLNSELIQGPNLTNS